MTHRATTPRSRYGRDLMRARELTRSDALAPIFGHEVAVGVEFCTRRSSPRHVHAAVRPAADATPLAGRWRLARTTPLLARRPRHRGHTVRWTAYCLPTNLTLDEVRPAGCVSSLGVQVQRR